MFKNVDEFVNGHALSFSSANALGDLFADVLNPAVTVTFVVGAGFSMNSGLPSWNQLLRNITRQLKNPDNEALAEIDPDHPTRRAEYLLRMAEDATGSDARSIVRDALYSSSRTPTPGPLIEGLADVANALGNRVRLLTTNFDHLLEDWLVRYGPATARPLIDSKIWNLSSGASEVLHLHGILRPRITPATAIVLTESDFLQQGPRVRKVIRERMATDVVVFLGVSLTDANLIGPLYDFASGRYVGTGVNRRYLVVVPDERESVDDSPEYTAQMEFFLSKTRAVTTPLAVEPIILKSHSQVAQLLWELNLALRGSSAYTRRAGKLTSTYGNRFVSKLKSAYAKLGAPATSDFLTGVSATRASQRLYDDLTKRGQLASYVNPLLKRFNTPGLEPERLALFLWLRTRKHGWKPAPYALSLVATSTYVQRESWSITPAQRISPISKFPAVRAVFGGIATMQNLFDPNRNVWRGSLAVPIRVGSGSELYTIGAITLNSSRFMIRESMPAWATDEDLSFVAKLTSSSEFAEMIARLEKAAIAVLN